MPNFPVKTALALATAILALAAYRLADPTKGLSPTIFPEAAHLTLLRKNPANLPPQTAYPTPFNRVQGDNAPSRPRHDVMRDANGHLTYDGCAVPNDPLPPGNGILPDRQPPVSPYLFDPCRNLDPFFAALRSLETNPTALDEGKPKVVTILHYGDSPTTADLITGDLRDLLQQRFGDAGRGFLLTAKPWAWYQHRGVDLADKNWQISTAVGKGRPEVYGLGGASFQGGPEASTRITLQTPTQPAATLEISYLAQPAGGTLAVAANGTPLETFSTALNTTRPAWHTLPLPPGTGTIDLKPTSGTVKLFGETLLTGRPGVVYDSLGLNGASTSVLSNGFNAEAWQIELQHVNRTLVIINYGTNESSYGPYVDKLYEPTLRTAITRIRTALPREPILIMSPMDRGRRSGVDQIETYDTIPRIIAIERRVAAEQNCAFFDTFNAMGGDGTMARWYTAHPRLVAGDLIHPTPQGAALVAHLFVHDLSLAYDRYLSSVPPPPAQTASANPTPRPIPQPTSSPIAQSAPRPIPTPASQPTIPSPVTSKPKPSAAGDPLPPPTPQPTPPPTTTLEAPQA